MLPSSRLPPRTRSRTRRAQRCRSGPPCRRRCPRPRSPSPAETDGPALESVRRRRVVDRLARRIVNGQRSTVVRPVLEPLAVLHRQSHPKADLALLQRAYDVAEAAHASQRRKSGDPYITHPLAWPPCSPAWAWTPPPSSRRCCTTRSRTPASLESIVTDFGPDVAHLVDGVTKIDKVQFGDGAQAETIRKMIVAMARDPRVLVIKLADRLHNMRTLRFLPPEKQEKKARETLEILAPLAHRLGMNTIKWELEDLAFATLYPKRYDEIVRLVAERAPSRDTYLPR